MFSKTFVRVISLLLGMKKAIYHSRAGDGIVSVEVAARGRVVLHAGGEQDAAERRERARQDGAGGRAALAPQVAAPRLAAHRARARHHLRHRLRRHQVHTVQDGLQEG